ncbi:hypothetical protein HYH03_005375 [Edaphochlamys debaryana]|uniref:Ankyrin repeat domain-containing protein n=1 Tax=Edaphochlamys debaryana TaxID=47281 RepID=A0A835Y7P0_9CHLO|nr:hypothetical protein HYH03_005375 [Edaphochlamys debaryana]|eukprot:KAG2496552.1 hypothetical protein HYH03_005375 [Edaphochlamys debaryana]
MSQHKHAQLSGSAEASPALVWTPGIVARIAACLPPNEAAYLSFVNKATAEELRGVAALRLSQPVSREIFASAWSRLTACRELTRAQRTQLVCLVAQAGDVANLQVAFEAAGLVPNCDMLKAAAAAGDLQCCRFLADPSRLPPTQAWSLVITEAAAGGHLELVEWCGANRSDLKGPCLSSLLGAARGGHRDVCEALVTLMPHEWLSRIFAMQAAASASLRGGHASLAIWLLSLCPLGEAPHVKRRPLSSAAEGCDLQALQHMSELLQASELSAQDWQSVLHACVSSRTADWREKAAWAKAQGGGVALFDRSTWFAVADKLDGPAVLERFVWLKAAGFGPPLGDRWTLRRSAERGDAAAVAWLLAEGVPLSVGSGAATVAATGGHIGVLQVLHQAGCPLEPRDLTRAAVAAGHLPTVQWLHEAFGAEALLPPAPRPADDEPSSSEGLCDLAARSGSVELMAWLRAQGCEARESAWRNGAESGCEAALRLLEQWQVPKPTDGGPYFQAARAGDLRTLGVLRDLGMHFGPQRPRPRQSLFCYAALEAPLASLQWLEAAGCPILDLAELEAAAEEGVRVGLGDERSPQWVRELMQRRGTRFKVLQVPARGGGVWTGQRMPKGSRRR